VIFVGLLATTTAGFAFGTDGDSWRGSLNISVLESGTYTVTAKRVDPEVKEIYVTTGGGKTLSLFQQCNRAGPRREGGALRCAQERLEA